METKLQQRPKVMILGKKLPTMTIKIIVILVVLLLLGMGAYYSPNVFSATASHSNQQNSGQLSAEDQKVLEQLKKIILLPENITPTMAIITNVEMLRKGQPGFFVNARNNDRLIVYPDLAIIFDPDANKIIKAGGIQINMPTAVPAASTVVPAKPKATK